MNKIRFIAILLTLSIICTNVSASVLGSILINGYTVKIGDGTTSTHNTWYSDQSGVGQQTENYILYEPNANVEPIITHGDYLYGATNISTEVSRIRKSGLVPLGGVNADFFSLQTGIPMSNIISDGKIVTKTGSPQYGIGILNDNTAFMSKHTLYSIMTKSDGTKMHIHMINKYRQPYSAYLLTNDFSAETRNNTKGYDVVLGSIVGEMKLGTTLTATVESITERTGSVDIPKGKMILTVDSNAPAEYLEPIKTLKPGETISISFSFEGDERWKNAKLGIGATGDVLIENGQLNSGFATGAHPRTALGITNEGKILLYTIDGRQKGYSYGVQLKTLANRLKELGCIDAINLDGGGSTSYIVQFPGEDVTKLVNKPSDGKLRSVGNFIFLKNNQLPTGILGGITIYPLNVGVLVNSSVKLTAKGNDTAYYPLTPSDLTFYVSDGTSNTVTKDGIFTAKENGTATVYAKSGNVVGKINIICLKTPTNMSFIDQSQKPINSLRINGNESTTISVKAYGGYNELVVSPEAIKWSCDDNIGIIDKTGKFTSVTKINNSNGKIYAQAGDKKIELDVTVNGVGHKYNDINITSDGNTLNIQILPIGGISVDKNDIIIKADSQNVNFEYQNNVVKAILPTTANKITVFVTNSFGCTSFATKQINDNKYQNPFIDTTNHWAKDTLSYMYSKKIINGEKINNNLVFNPNKSMTRSEFAVMISNYLNINTENYKDVILPYKDITKIPPWALNSFKALYKLGIIKGSYIGNELFVSPLDNITRAEGVTIISRTLPAGIKKSPITYADKADVADWAKEGFEILISIGAIKGYEDGKILPKRNLSKAEAAKILYEII